MSKFIKSSLLAVATALSMGAHAAPTASYDFYSNGGGWVDSLTNSLNFTANGIGLTITPVSTNSDAKVAYRWDGIGLSAGFLEPNELNSSLLHTPGDALLLSFNQAVSLNSVAFSLWEGNSLGALDKATITTGGQTYALSASLNDGGFFVDTFGLTGVIPAGQFFVIQAQGDLSSFRLAGLNVTAAVPEASTTAMFVLGLAGVAAVVRRRKA
jgi:hypothetical protein